MVELKCKYLEFKGFICACCPSPFREVETEHSLYEKFTDYSFFDFTRSYKKDFLIHYTQFLWKEQFVKTIYDKLYTKYIEYDLLVRL